MNYKKNYRVEDLLKDNGFICYALNISSESSNEWDNLLKEYSELAKEARSAKAILTGKDMTYTLKPTEHENLKRRVFNTLGI